MLLLDSLLLICLQNARFAYYLLVLLVLLLLLLFFLLVFLLFVVLLMLLFGNLKTWALTAKASERAVKWTNETKYEQTYYK